MTTPSDIPLRSELAAEWNLDPTIVFLNHGSFGACPRAVLETQTGLRTRLESEPVRFFIRELPELLDGARERLAAFVAADANGLAFVNNATTGVNTALATIPLSDGDEILVTDDGYPACRNAARVRADRCGAHVLEARVPFPLSSPDEVVTAILEAVTARTRVAIIDHVTSPTGVVNPVAEILRELETRNVTVIIDGAHAPGMLDLNIDALAPAFYTGNCHKWLCAPKGAAFLWVREDWRKRTHPLVTSHGASMPLIDRSRFRLEFDWTGTGDPTAWLSVPAAIDTVGAMIPGGWSEVQHRNRALALQARSEIVAALGLAPPCPASMIGSLAAIPLPPGLDAEAVPANGVGRIQEVLYSDHRIEVPVTVWGDPPRNALRISAHLYNRIDEYRHLISCLTRDSTVAATPTS